ncbi:family S53 protease [Auricularia subglabra TFB-10046 SS5]|nr:family S53 protease [Auricularia subglabra TFB-10046 SS5]
MLVGLVVLALALSNGATSAAAKPPMRVHERRARAPAGFTALNKADGRTQLTMRLALKQHDSDGLVDALYRVSDPASADYGNHLSAEEVNAFMAPTPDTVSAVNAWLSDNGIKAIPVSPAGDWIEFTLPVSKANDVFDADFTVFQHQQSKSQGIRTLQYSIPENLQSSIQVLFPGASFWSPSSSPKFTPIGEKAAIDKRQDDPCQLEITPSCLQKLYGIPSTPANVKSNKLAVSGFIEQYANQADLTQFLTEQRPDIANATFETQLIDGGVNPQDRDLAGIEANLDIQYTVGIATKVQTVFISVGDDNKDDIAGFLDIIYFLLGQRNQPKVLTTSYGFDEVVITPDLGNSLCIAYAALGLRGTSILFASGDGGVSGIQAESCTTFGPTFPSGCPFVTSVGATTGIPETSAFFSSGGFSNIFPRPPYQKRAVSKYQGQIGSLYAGLYNTTGRAFPDVAAMGDNVLIVWDEIEGLVAGTSCSSPIFASIVALINDLRAQKGRHPLGFLNPFLYANPQVFNDIKTGNNPGCGTDGFPALKGWDPVTGLGTPIFKALAAAAGVRLH